MTCKFKQAVMKKGIKIALTSLGIVLVLMFILPFAFRGKIESIVKTEGNKMLNAKFNFRRLDISLFKNFPKASITLNDFWLKGIEEFENDTLVNAGEVTVAVNLYSLFSDKGYDISKISIEDSRFHAIILPDGKVNWDVMKPDTIPAEAEENVATPSPFRIKLQRFVVKNMNIIYDDRQGNMYASISGFNALCSGDLSDANTLLDIEAETESLTYKLNGVPFLYNANIYAKMDVDADLVNNKFTLKDNEFRLNAIRTAIDGWVHLKTPAIDMDLKLNTNEVGFKDILSLIPAIYSKEFKNLKTEGAVILSISAKGTLQGDTVPQFQANMQVKNAMFRYPSLPAGVDGINISANITNPGGNIDLTEISINPFEFRLGGNPFNLAAQIKTPVSDLDFMAQAKGTLNLGMINQVYPIEDMELNGIITADMGLAGRLSYIEKDMYERLNASGNIELKDMKLNMKDMPSVDIKKSLFTFSPKYLQLSETAVNIGKNDITADCRFENYMGYALKGTTLKGTLNIRSNHFNLNDFMKVDSTQVVAEENTEMTTGIIEVPANIDFQMNADMKKILFGTLSIDKLNGNLIIKDSKVNMKNLAMNTMGGSVVTNGYYSTADKEKPEMNAGFSMKEISFSQAYKDLDMVQKLAPVFENLKGNFSGKMNIQTLLDAQMSPIMETVKGDGSLSTRDISLSGVTTIDRIADAVKKPELKDIKVKDLAIDFTIDKGRISTTPFDIKMGDYVMNLSGSTGLDQTIDYSGKIKLPESTGNISKLSTFDLKIGGSFTSPKVSLDTKSMANQALEAVKGKAVEEIGKKLGLDSTITANKDSLKKKVTEKATEKALDFLKKKKK